MQSQPLIAPSILSADFSRLGEDIDDIASADWIHFDVMDGHFVPNLSFGVPVLKSIVGKTDLPIDCHLMIENPERWAPDYARAGGSSVTFHIEAAREPVALARELRSLGCRAAFSVKPITPIEPYLELLPEFDMVLVMSVEPGFGGQSFMPEVLDKVRVLRTYIDEHNLETLIQIDGGIAQDTIGQAHEAGCDCFVAGSAVYNYPDRAQAIEDLRQAAVA